MAADTQNNVSVTRSVPRRRCESIRPPAQTGGIVTRIAELCRKRFANASSNAQGMHTVCPPHPVLALNDQFTARTSCRRRSFTKVGAIPCPGIVCLHLKDRHPLFPRRIPPVSISLLRRVNGIPPLAAINTFSLVQSQQSHPGQSRHRVRRKSREPGRDGRDQNTAVMRFVLPPA